jgi:membrane-bound metal-dependent hydrolase YbcI (DUF457 family)
MSTEGERLPSFSPTLQVLDMFSLLCLCWLLCSQFWKFRMDLQITLYMVYMISGLCHSVNDTFTHVGYYRAFIGI